MFSRVTILFLWSALFLYAYASGWEYVDCGSPSQPLRIDSIELSPDPPVPGQDLSVTVKANVTETIEEGAAAGVVVKLGLIKLVQKTFDVCEEARNANAPFTCPVQPGPYTVVHTVALPREIPKAKFLIQVRGLGDSLCLDLRINFMKSAASIFTSPF
ncbi:ML domain-containing protein [Mycena belliarum]|uniref:Phosphatidylglycerol/phosphatidylinositol transfer protein n=1 Tax=Mycena belliarum TaxID=1033014 RepID=A0AAD6Y1S9_9AGAR|nr:ML domain-containing protein [Mycena belliae]